MAPGALALAVQAAALVVPASDLHSIIHNRPPTMQIYDGVPMGDFEAVPRSAMLRGIVRDLDGSRHSELELMTPTAGLCTDGSRKRSAGQRQYDVSGEQRREQRAVQNRVRRGCAWC